MGLSGEKKSLKPIQWFRGLVKTAVPQNTDFHRENDEPIWTNTVEINVSYIFKENQVQCPNHM